MTFLLFRWWIAILILLALFPPERFAFFSIVFVSYRRYRHLHCPAIPVRSKLTHCSPCLSRGDHSLSRHNVGRNCRRTCSIAIIRPSACKCQKNKTTSKILLSFIRVLAYLCFLFPLCSYSSLQGNTYHATHFLASVDSFGHHYDNNTDHLLYIL